ncbi:MAG TPA: hypothetical protein VIX35_05730, partial [Vicinamibacterales bacterium]
MGPILTLSMFPGALRRAMIAVGGAVIAALLAWHPAALAQAPSACGPALRCTAIDADHFQWVKDLSGESTHDATLAGHFSDLVLDVSPDATYHFHFDMPVGSALRAILRGAGEPVTIRANRFAMLSACDTPTCTGARAFVWVDTEHGVEIGGIEFEPSNGEPTPTLTLFSKQVLDPVTKRVQLPADFIEDLATWTRVSRRRATPARYFINGQGVKTVLAHDEDNCHGADQSSLAATLCRSLNVDAAEQDLAAAYYLLSNSFADGTAM